jgi:methylenetetrahydrofolate reductase (NADPH)
LLIAGLAAMSLSAAYGPGRFGLSFGLFPPKTPQGVASLFEHVTQLIAFRPSLITCTYGAGGSSQDMTLEIVSRVRREFGLPVATHLTCVGRTTEQLRDYLTAAQAQGIESVVALRGDPPRGDSSFRPVPGGLRYANELVGLIRAEFPDFGVAVAGYPEKHPEAPSLDADLVSLKRKVDAGAHVVITQLFYDNDDFFRFRDLCAARGIRVPIVPGVMPITNLAKIQRFTSFCGAKLPPELVSRLASAGEDDDAQLDIGVDFAVKQVQALLDAGVPGIHFYVLNRSEAVTRVLADVPLDRRT